MCLPICLSNAQPVTIAYGVFESVDPEETAGRSKGVASWERDRQSVCQRDRQTDRQTDRQKDRKTGARVSRLIL